MSGGFDYDCDGVEELEWPATGDWDEIYWETLAVTCGDCFTLINSAGPPPEGEIPCPTSAHRRVQCR